MRVAVLDDYQGIALRMANWSTVQQRCTVEVFDRKLAVPDEAARVLAPFDIVCLMRERMAMPRELIERLPNLKLIVTTGSRNRSLDLAAATERGVLVCHTAAGDGQYATAELTWGLILSLFRHLPEEITRMRSGGWQQTLGHTLRGRTLGLLGLGRIGSQVARVGAAFGMHPIAWSQNLTQEAASNAGATRVDKETLFRESDVLTIHLVLSERTRSLVGPAELALMKPGALLVNTSRGPIVQEAALIDALRDGRIGGAALDVFDQEPLPDAHPLRQCPNTVLTPHLGYTVEEVFRVFYEDTIADILAFLNGKPIRVANPDVLG